ncbi:peptide chain release factor N(5)-glutamine methyltransferase [Desulfovibrio mangrovi]|uniref:peptide chain release factor N(5)-glutamine methyltransferase n=1 Tax=Desulfovibrio mangrovi TaxID=2976983 RepID=UPI002246E6B4|nr:peptide chain release factor N(5)-glutamine methyltransferase [Desulfovibrio mangrovi]UZP67122.1 peptide chain release factor N(5)-glutamine methyltransferase [Desulfovibrio mangrovi]
MAIARPAQLTIRTITTAFSEYLSGKAVDSPRLSADLLCMHILGASRLDLLTDPHRPVTEDQWAAIAELVERRGKGEPVAYLLGSREFYGRDFAVSPATLIPRPETEHIIEEVVRRFAGKGPFLFADLGTGTGCIATTIAAELPDAMGIAVDISPDALAIAATNAAAHGVRDRLAFVNADFMTPLFQNRSLHCIATNPPYISEAEYAELSHEVREFEPRTALVPGTTGLEHAAALIRNAENWLKPDGIFIMEMGYTQAAPNLSHLQSREGKWRDEKIISDLAGLDRMTFAVRTSQ